MRKNIRKGPHVYKPINEHAYKNAKPGTPLYHLRRSDNHFHASDAAMDRADKHPQGSAMYNKHMNKALYHRVEARNHLAKMNQLKQKGT